MSCLDTIVQKQIERFCHSAKQKQQTHCSGISHTSNIEDKASSITVHQIIHIMQSFVPSSSEPLSVQQLQVELHVLSTKVEKLTKENADLRTYLRNSANESTLRRDYESIVVEKDRLVKLVEQLKNEKKNLVETVLQLSNEVDAVHKTSDQLEQDRQLYIQTDSIIRSARRKLGLQVLGVLESKGIGSDDPIMKVDTSTKASSYIKCLDF